MAQYEFSALQRLVGEVRLGAEGPPGAPDPPTAPEETLRLVEMVATERLESLARSGVLAKPA